MALYLVGADAHELIEIPAERTRRHGHHHRGYDRRQDEVGAFERERASFQQDHAHEATVAGQRKERDAVGDDGLASLQKQALGGHVRFAKRNVWSLAEARAALEQLIGQSQDWSRIDEYLISYLVEPAMRATVFASSFASALELVREGVAEIHQHEAFAPIYMRKRMLVSEPAGDSAGRAGPQAAEG